MGQGGSTVAFESDYIGAVADRHCDAVSGQVK